MKLNRKSHRRLRVQNLIFTLLFLALIALLGALSIRYNYQSDWTADGRNTLSVASRRVLDTLEGGVTVTAFALEEKLTRDQIRDLVGRYSRHKKDLTLTFVNPDLEPDKVREFNITRNGELVVAFDGRHEAIQQPSEATLTNTLLRLAQADERWVTFLGGHNERRPHGETPGDFGRFGGELARKGIKAQSLSLGAVPDIPANTSVLVIADPQLSLLPGEIQLVENYLARGQNLLWLVEPNRRDTLAPLAARLGLNFLPGTVVDTATRLFNIDNPAFAVIADYPDHPVTQRFDNITLFPTALALEKSIGGEFEAQAILSTAVGSWTETSPIEGTIRFDADSDERKGPLNVGMALTRTMSIENGEKEQRIVVIGDADFLSNAYLGNGGNLDLGLNLIRWLSHDDQFINIPAKTARDKAFSLTPVAAGVMGFGFLVVLPLGLAGCGAFIWYRRRRR